MKESKNSNPSDCEKTPFDCCDTPNFKKNSVANVRLGQCHTTEEMYREDDMGAETDV